MSWHTGRLACFDLETTGVDPETARVVQIAFVDLTPADPGDLNAPAYTVNRWSTIVDPGIDIPDGAAEVHGITTERARTEGVPPVQALTEALTLVDDAWAAGAPLIGHNLGGYDITLFDRELRRHLDQPLDVGPVLDTLCLDKAYDRYRKGKRTLEVTAQHYDVRLDGAHDATEDALAAARILWRMCRLFPQLPATPLAELQDFQRTQYADSSASLEKYFKKLKRKDGEPQSAIDAVHVNRDWPIRPWTDPTGQEAVA